MYPFETDGDDSAGEVSGGGHPRKIRNRSMDQSTSLPIEPPRRRHRLPVKGFGERHGVYMSVGHISLSMRLSGRRSGGRTLCDESRIRKDISGVSITAVRPTLRAIVVEGYRPAEDSVFLLMAATGGIPIDHFSCQITVCWPRGVTRKSNHRTRTGDIVSQSMDDITIFQQEAFPFR